MTAANDLHWQALAEKRDAALLGLWSDPRRGAYKMFQRALANLGHARVIRSHWYRVVTVNGPG